MTSLILLQGDLNNTQEGLEILSSAQEGIERNLRTVKKQIDRNHLVYIVMLLTAVIGILILTRTPYWYIGAVWTVVSFIFIQGVHRKNECLKDDRRLLENAFMFNRHQLFTIRQIVETDCEDVKSAKVVGHVVYDRHGHRKDHKYRMN